MIDVKVILEKERIVYKNSLYMMATKAYHVLGDLSRNENKLCKINGEVDNYYYGNWIEGLGFCKVLFPKESTRLLSEKEIQRFKKQKFELSGIVFKLDLC